ncbi:MAG: hypothetical protein RBU37_17685 [Myxococcota bacterium]|jgi:hypothetical protein|nr:hypothetical protein [Myxococcota bacterium]
MNPSRQLTIFLSVALLLSTGCTSEDEAGSGALSIAVGGGAAVREGFPHDEGAVRFEFADGWTLQFSKYIVSVGNVTLSSGAGKTVASWPHVMLMDLTTSPTASLDLALLEGVPALRHEIAFDVRPPDADTTLSEVDEADAALMRERGWSLLAEGSAVHPTHGTVRFRLGLPLARHYYNCINGKDQTQGIAIEANKTTGVFIYAHAIHIFWDTLSTGDEDLRFEAFAAMRGDDDLVTEEELEEQDLNNLRGIDGQRLLDQDGSPVFYNDNGLLRPGEQTLYHFVLQAFRSSAHFNGVGLCSDSALVD